ncbi:hypothetical protein [Spiroplasma endosymbiont of Colias croceus]|uniref:hypothetical protein n=1 Tax=Spiroplasma endosymbiont of Colias croceus TaxID=3066310 RepID=UPI0030CADE15
MKINNSSSVISIAIDSKDDIYFGKSDFLFSSNNGLYKLFAGSDTPTKINGINESVS